MKTFLSKLAVFIIICCVTYPIAVYIVAEYFPAWIRPNVQYFHNGDGYMKQRLQEADSTSDIDILFLGSSHTYQAYNPENFPEYKIMNLGSSNQTHVQTSFLTEKYLEQFNPRLIIYEINPNMLNNDDTESSIDIISNSEFSNQYFNLMRSENAVRIMNTIIFKFLKDIISPVTTDVPLNDAYGDKYISSGFVLKNKGNNTTFDNDEFIFIPHQINSNASRALKKNIEYITAHNTPLILVYTPVTKNFYKFTGGEKKIETTLSEYPQIPYYNFNVNNSWNDTTDFYDEHHLNQNGINKYNALIKNIIDSVLVSK